MDGRRMSWIFWITVGFVVCESQGNNCSKPLESCLRCDTTGSKCLKCRNIIVYRKRDCVESCPMGYTQKWSTYNDYMGRICVETSFISSLGFTGETFAVLVGAFTGTLLCLCALLGGCIYIRRRRIKALSVIDENSDSTLTVTPLHQQEKADFIREISLLRHEAPVFLSMLNETRRQFREMNKSKLANHKKEIASHSYRPVLRDLCIILMLLNKPDEKIVSPPPEWRKLLLWGERVLKRYKRQNNITSPLGDLVSFLQVPDQRYLANSRGSLLLPYGTLSTVSTNTLTSTMSRKQKNGNTPVGTHHKIDMSQMDYTSRDSIVNDRLSDCNAILQTDYPNISSLNSFSDAEFDGWDESHTILAEWSASRECLFEDDFIRLGFRPQDEITTEL